MRILIQRLSTGMSIGLLCIFVFSCTSRSMLKINYTLPEVSGDLSGVNVAMSFEDQRSDQDILDKSAKREFKNFTGQFSFSDGTENQHQLVGEYDLSRIIEKTIKQRLKKMGADVIAAPNQTDLVLTIILKEFQMTFKERIWQVGIRYEAQLKTDEKIRAREEVTGSGTRVKIIGTGDADKLISSVYTDVMNQLNIEKLFKKAQLE